MVAIIVSTEIDGDYIDVGALLFVPGSAGGHSARFTYDPEFVRRGWPIDPSLPLDDGAHELPGLPLAVLDASPDAWGQLLLQRAERHRARDGEGARRLTPDMILLAASDATRQGALRFRTDHDGPFLGENGTIPKVLALEALLAAAAEVDRDTAAPDWSPFARLLDAGSSALGGARPKAAVYDEDGRLWLAKFPRVGDSANVPVWEMVALDIAERAGLHVPDRKLLPVAGRQVLLVRRFDRDDNGRRLSYISTRTLMGARDLGPSYDYGGRRGIARRLARESGDPRTDLLLLWKQAALNLLVNNTDNHLRNHGLVRGDGAWRLSPVFDLDPNPDTGTIFNTHVGDGANRSTGLRGLMRIAADCGLDPARAREELARVHEAVAGWDTDAAGYGATDHEIDEFRHAFRGLDGEVEAVLSHR